MSRSPPESLGGNEKESDFSWGGGPAQKRKGLNVDSTAPRAMCMTF